MCGIAVAIGWPEAELTVQKLVQGILHRGDITDPVMVLRKDTAMGTRRLRIVDSEHAVQPQLSANRRIAVAFNGEIYNHADLRRELGNLGIVFRTQSDTEVLANALQSWGLRALERVTGMYAFVAVDIASGEFLAARDPFGVKPLYAIQSGNSFLFCSEMRPPVYPRADVPVRHDALALDGVLSDAVRVRMPPDLPAATLFSGGIDSTLVAHYARQHRPETPGYFAAARTRRTILLRPNMPNAPASTCGWCRSNPTATKPSRSSGTSSTWPSHSSPTWCAARSAR
jgi:asparagine synthase (glutamine-hydrolysing)